MELHRILAPDASKATAEALRIYGPEALVISTRRLKNARTEVIVATEGTEHSGGVGPSNSAAERSQGSESEAQGGKAFKAAFEAQLEAPETGRGKAAFLRATVENTDPAQEPADEGLLLLNAIREELARLRSEVGALKVERREMVQFQDKDRLEALGLPEESLPSILEALAEGALPPLPKLSDGAGAQAQWLAQLLKSADELNPLQGTHILRAEDPRVQVELATALAKQGEQRYGSGATLLIAVGQDDAHWRQVTQAALAEGLQVLRARDGLQVSSLLAHDNLGNQMRLLLPATGEEADALRREPALQSVPRHQILPAHRLTSPFLGTLLGGSETDTVMVHQFHKDVPLEHFVATMLRAGKGVSVLQEESGSLSEGLTASLSLMAAWAAREQTTPVQPEAGTASPWPLALHG